MLMLTSRDSRVSLEAEIRHPTISTTTLAGEISRAVRSIAKEGGIEISEQRDHVRVIGLLSLSTSMDGVHRAHEHWLASPEDGVGGPSSSRGTRP